MNKNKNSSNINHNNNNKKRRRNKKWKNNNNNNNKINMNNNNNTNNNTNNTIPTKPTILIARKPKLSYASRISCTNKSTSKRLRIRSSNSEDNIYSSSSTTNTTTSGGRSRSLHGNLSRDSLLKIRMQQRDICYVAGLPKSICNRNILGNKKWFGQFGRIRDITITDNENCIRTNWMCVHIKYFENISAAKAVQAMNHKKLDDGRVLEANYGTQRYCEFFINNKKCHKISCPFRHSWCKLNEIVNFNHHHQIIYHPYQTYQQHKKQVASPPQIRPQPVTVNLTNPVQKTAPKPVQKAIQIQTQTQTIQSINHNNNHNHNNNNSVPSTSNSSTDLKQNDIISNENEGEHEQETETDNKMNKSILNEYNNEADHDDEDEEEEEEAVINESIHINQLQVNSNEEVNEEVNGNMNMNMNVNEEAVMNELYLKIECMKRENESQLDEMNVLSVELSARDGEIIKLQKISRRLVDAHNRIKCENDKLLYENQQLKKKLSMNRTMNHQNNMNNMNKICILNDLNYLDYTLWEWHDVYEWLMTIENGKFKKYSDILSLNLKLENIDGSCIKCLTINDIHRIGVLDYKYKQIIFEHIQNLKSNLGLDNLIHDVHSHSQHSQHSHSHSGNNNTHINGDII